MEEWVPIEPDHLVGNAVFAKIISYELGDEEYDLVVRIGLGTSGLKVDIYAILLTIVGRMYVRAPVSSNMITTTVSVIRITPLRNRRCISIPVVDSEMYPLP